MAEPVAGSIRRRLLLWLVPSSCAVLAVSGLASFYLADHYTRNLLDQWLADSANTLALATVPGPEGLRLELSEAAQRALQWDSEDESWYRLSADGHGTLAGSPALPLAAAAAQRVTDVWLYDAIIDGQAVRVARIDLPAAPGAARAMLAVAETTHKRQRTAREMALAVLMPAAALALLFNALLLLAVRRTVDPLHALASHLGELSLLQRTQLPEQSTPLEVRPLVAALNDLLRRLAHALRNRQEFLATAAHDLRTPLAAALLHLEQVRAAEPDSSQSLRTAQQALRRAARATQQVLDFVHADSAELDHAAMQRVDLCEIAGQIGAELAPVAVARRQVLSLELAAEHVVVQGMPDLIATALANLLDNAIKYSPEGGHIVVSVLAAPGPALRVADDGPGLPAHMEVEPLLMRHRRGPQLAAGVRVDGSGLGLAIAHEVAQRHQGRLELGPGLEGRGLCATLWFRPGPDAV